MPEIQVELIIKTFLDQQPIKTTFSERNNLLDQKNIIEFEELYLSIRNQKEGNIFSTDELHNEIISLQENIDKKMSSTDVWKILPGKKVLNPILQLTNKEFSIKITKEDLISCSKKSKLTKETIDRIQEYFNSGINEVKIDDRNGCKES